MQEKMSTLEKEFAYFEKNTVFLGFHKVTLNKQFKKLSDDFFLLLNDSNSLNYFFNVLDFPSHFQSTHLKKLLCVYVPNMKSEIVASSLEIFGFSKQTETLLFYLKKLWNFFLDFFIFFFK